MDDNKNKNYDMEQFQKCAERVEGIRKVLTQSKENVEQRGKKGENLNG